MVHIDAAAWGRAHACPQAPQLAALFWVSASQPSIAMPLQSP